MLVKFCNYVTACCIISFKQVVVAGQNFSQLYPGVKKQHRHDDIKTARKHCISKELEYSAFLFQRVKEMEENEYRCDNIYGLCLYEYQHKNNDIKTTGYK